MRVEQEGYWAVSYPGQAWGDREKDRQGGIEGTHIKREREAFLGLEKERGTSSLGRGGGRIGALMLCNWL